MFEQRYRIISIVLVLLMLFAFLMRICIDTEGYKNTNEYNLDSYEIIADVPWMVERGGNIPVLLMVHDADKAPANRIALTDVHLSIYDKDKVLLASKSYNATQLGAASGNRILFITEETWSKVVLFTSSDLAKTGGQNYVGEATAEAIFSLGADPEIPELPQPEPPTPPTPPQGPASSPRESRSGSGEIHNYMQPQQSTSTAINVTRKRSFDIFGDDLSSFSSWYLGEVHEYSNYTETRSNFGAPVAAISRMGNALGLDWVAITDNSTSLTEEGKFSERNRRMKDQNEVVPRPLLISGEEVVCSNNEAAAGTNYGKLLVYGADWIDSTFDYRGNTETAEEVIEAVEKERGATYIEDVFGETELFKPWKKVPENVTGLEVWKGGDPYNKNNARMMNKWRSLLLEGRRIYAAAGSGGYGEFGKMGRVRTMSFLPNGLGKIDVIRALRRGNTVLTNGPIVTFTAENEKGDEFVIGRNEDDLLEGKEITLEAKYHCDSMFGTIEDVDLHIGTVGGDEIAVELDTEEDEVEITSYLPVNREAYVRMSVNSTDGESRYFAMTNPIWVRITNEPPTANAGKNIEIEAGDKARLTGKGTDPDGDIELYEWDFQGDGEFDWSSTTTGVISYEYDDPGEYTATLRVTDDGGLSARDNTTVRVKEPFVNTPPRVDAGNDVVVKEGEEVALTAKVEDDEENVVSYEWTEKGKLLSASLVLKKKDFEVGLHVLVFTATDAAGASDSDSVKVVVEQRENILPNALLKLSVQKGSEVYRLRSVTFDASGSSDPDGEIAEYKFDFGDGTVGDWQESSKAVHRYRKVGSFDVTVTVRDDRGAVVESDPLGITVIKSPTQPESPQGTSERIKTLIKDNPVLPAILIVLILSSAVIAFFIITKRKKEDLIFQKVGERGGGRVGSGNGTERDKTDRGANKGKQTGKGKPRKGEKGKDEKKKS